VLLLTWIGNVRRRPGKYASFELAHRTLADGINIREVDEDTHGRGGGVEEGMLDESVVSSLKNPYNDAFDLRSPWSVTT
jgi:hypothetical protein